MKENMFLNSSTVKNFAIWIESKMDKPNSLNHAYNMKKPQKRWECDSIYSAFENYYWTFRYTDPFNGDIIKGKTFNESSESLFRLSQGLRQSIKDSNSKDCIKHCLSILDWGGVLAKNDKKIYELGDNICDYFNNVTLRLTANMPSGDYYNDQIIMNSGFTKIYSLLLDDFIIYDGRVGAALGLLVRKFCEDNHLDKVPVELSFAWGKGKESTYVSSKENKRNPGSGKYIFSELMNNPKRHTENNIRANWLLCEVIKNTDSKFKMLDSRIRMRSLEAALFMIGYDVAFSVD